MHTPLLPALWSESLAPAGGALRARRRPAGGMAEPGGPRLAEAGLLTARDGLPPASPYAGCPILPGPAREGFRIGLVTDLCQFGGYQGDAFIVAPDLSCAGLIWEVARTPRLGLVAPASPERWGIWEATVAGPILAAGDLLQLLDALLPHLRPAWRAWQDEQTLQAAG